MLVTACRTNEEDPCCMLLARRGRHPKLRFCLKMKVCYIFLGFRIDHTGSSFWWQLVDISENYMLLYIAGEPFRLVVFNVVKNIFQMFGVPDEFSLDYGEYVIKIIAEEGGYKVICAQIHHGNRVWYGVYHSSLPGCWSRGVLERMDDKTQEVDDGRNNIMLYDDEGDQLYTIFFREGMILSLCTK